MFFYKYLNDIYLDMLYEQYDELYLKSINEEKFIKIYNLLKEYEFYFIEDIIINCLEIFEYNKDVVERNILKLKKMLGDNFVWQIGNDLTYLNNLSEIDN